MDITEVCVLPALNDVARAVFIQKTWIKVSDVHIVEPLCRVCIRTLNHSGLEQLH